MIKKIGSEYGGHFLDIDLVQPSSLVISAGIGGDVSFDQYLIKHKNCYVLALDPDPNCKKLDKNFIFLNRVLYGENNVEIKLGARAVTLLCKKKLRKYTVKSITLDKIFEYLPQSQVSVLKMDIEGSEFSVIKNIKDIRVPQICIEFHHWLGDENSSSKGQVENPYTFADTATCIKVLESKGYTLAKQHTEIPERKIEEALFIRSDLL